VAPVDDEPADLRVGFGEEQGTDEDVHPADHVAARPLGDVDGVLLAPPDALDPPLDLFGGRGTTQLAAQGGDAPGVARLGRPDDDLRPILVVLIVLT